MTATIGLRREDKNIWERRVAITPDHVQQLQRQFGLCFRVQPYPTRAYHDVEYERAGARLDEDLTPCDVILGIKEIPIPLLLANKVYFIFSHTIKGQKYNMPMLRRLMELGCTLIDYECIRDESGRRLVFFGRFAGMAGMLETLRVLGRRLQRRGHETLLAELRPAHAYHDVADARAHLESIGRAIEADGLPQEIRPLVIGFSGYGHVSRGAQEMFDLLPHRRVDPDDLPRPVRPGDPSLIKVVFEEKHMAEAIDPSRAFDLQEYFNHPENYRGIFERHLPYLHVLANGIYWDERFPRLVTRSFVRRCRADGRPLPLEVIGDISCDINGSIEFTVKATTPDQPFLIYDPDADVVRDGCEGDGVVVMAVDNLPAVFPRDASSFFSQSLEPFLPAVAAADWRRPLEEIAVDPAIKNAVIVHRGALTPAYAHLSQHLSII